MKSGNTTKIYTTDIDIEVCYWTTEALPDPVFFLRSQKIISRERRKYSKLNHCVSLQLF